MASPSQAEASTESGECTEPEHAVTDHDIEDVHISGAPAVVTWIDEEDGQKTKYLCHSTHDHVTLHVHHDATSNTAFFQLRANVAIKAKRDKTHIFISIRPERIQSITVVDDHEHEASAKLGTSTYGLEFKLARPPALIVPKGDLTPKQKGSRLVLDSLRALAGQTSFAVHLATTTLAKDQLVSLCEVASSGMLQSMPKLLDVASLYGGKGGSVIEHESVNSVEEGFAAAPAGAQVESPPSYDEIGSSPHPSLNQKPSNKRRRASSGSEHYAASSSYKCMSMDMQAICSKMLESIDHGFSDLSNRMGRMEQRLTDLEACMKCHADKLEGSIERVNQNSSEQVDELRGELDTGLYDLRKETEDIITVRVEDEVYAAQQELSEHVQDEMENVEQRVGERLQQRLSNATLSMDINWDE